MGAIAKGLNSTIPSLKKNRQMELKHLFNLKVAISKAFLLPVDPL